MRCDGEEFVGDGDEDGGPALLWDAVGHRGESSSHESEKAPAHDRRQERRVQQDLHHDPLAARHVLDPIVGFQALLNFKWVET